MTERTGWVNLADFWLSRMLWCAERRFTDLTLDYVMRYDKALEEAFK
jgi:hypothetical protein